MKLLHSLKAVPSYLLNSVMFDYSEISYPQRSKQNSEVFLQFGTPEVVSIGREDHSA